MNKVIIGNQNGEFKQFEKKIKFAVFKILKIFKKDDVAIEIFLVGNREMLFLNKTLRKKNKPTNVLSFPEPKNFPHPEFKNKKIDYLGAIYLDIPYIKKEAKISLVDIDFLMVELLIHGILHLLGFIHKKKNDRIKMEKKEKYVYNSFRYRNK
ncbi:MAG: rRNA maturation RNase YbeY [Patescibacteria group bacterium]